MHVCIWETCFNSCRASAYFVYMYIYVNVFRLLYSNFIYSSLCSVIMLLGSFQYLASSIPHMLYCLYMYMYYMYILYSSYMYCTYQAWGQNPFNSDKRINKLFYAYLWVRYSALFLIFCLAEFALLE